jgi:hypothetical protein
MAHITDESIMEERMRSCEDLANRFMQGLYQPSEQSLREQIVSLALAASFIGQALQMKREASSDPA